MKLGRIPVLVACAGIFLASALFSSSARAAERPADWATLNLEGKVDWLLSKMTLAEKVEQLNIAPDRAHDRPGRGSCSQVPDERLGIFPIRAGDGPRGPRPNGRRPANRTTSGPTGPVSPTALCIASSWNPKLEEQMGHQWGLLCREYGLNALFAPGLNMIIDPRAGRDTDYAGEDPCQTGAYGVAIIKGIQSTGVAAVMKHFVANNWESGRQSHDVEVPIRPLHELYLPAFRMCVQEANPLGIMTCYNSVNGTWGSANQELLADIARKEWGFKGFFISDWGAKFGSAAQAIKAGQDLELPGQLQWNYAVIKQALDRGEMTMADIDARVAEVLRVKFGMLKYKADDAPSGYHLPDFKRVMREVGDEGMVLLKNDDAILPLRKTESVALIGPFADNQAYTIGNAGSSSVWPSYAVTVRDALQARGIAVKYAEGGCNGSTYNGAGFSNSFPCRIEFFNGQTFQGQPVYVTNAPALQLDKIEAEKISTLINDGYEGKALRSSGQTRIRAGRTPDSREWSVSMMIRLQDQLPAPDKNIVVMWSPGRRIALTANHLGIEIGKLVKSIPLNWRDMNGRWINVFFAHDGNNLRLYRDGKLIAEFKHTGEIKPMDVIIGDREQGLPMDVDQLETWKTALTPASAQNQKPAFVEPFEHFVVNGQSSGIPGILNSLNVSARVAGRFAPARPGKVVFRVESNGGVRIKIDGKLVYDLFDEQKAEGTKNQFSHIFTDTKPHDMVVEFASKNRTAPGFLKMSYTLPPPENIFAPAVAAAKASDVAVVCVGVPSTLQAENIDRPQYMLPSWQDELVNAVARANPKTAVVLFTAAGADVTPWLKNVRAVLQAFHPGSEGGNIIADVLYGDVNPSGRLTVTWPKSEADLPTTGPVTHYANTVCEFGYRYFDQRHIAPQFPFGFGLSYTTFEYKSIEARPSGNPQYPVTATVAVKNTGKVAGKEVVQVYVSDTEPTAVEQPVKKLAGFAKVLLQPGETKHVTIPLYWPAFQFFDVNANRWVPEPGKFEVAAARSATDLEKSTSLVLNKE